MIPSPVRDINYNAKWGLYFLHTTLSGACKHRELSLTSRLYKPR